jgi:hypothetical protein
MTGKTPSDDDFGSAAYGLAKAIEGAGESVAGKLHDLYHIEQIADHLGNLGSALNGLANATALSVIAQYGSTEDRAEAVSHLKSWFEEFRSK